jgi:hypothetical protein
MMRHAEAKVVSKETGIFNPLTPELNPATQRGLMCFFARDFNF